MGGRGSRSGGAPGGGLGGGGMGVAGPQLGVIPQGPPPNVQPGQPVPAISVAQLQAMNDTEFVNYLNGLHSTPIDPLTYFNADWGTQRLIANMPELNRAPDVVDPQSFSKLPGETLYRTVNAEGKETAVDICARTMASDVTTIGAGRMGDGFYFDNTLYGSQVYGNTRGNINKTATMQVKLNANAKIVSETRIKSMLAGESQAVQNAVRALGGGQWSGSGIMAYALKKGYNVVRANGGYHNIIDRCAATWSGAIIPK